MQEIERIKKILSEIIPAGLQGVFAFLILLNVFSFVFS